jgi:dTDP-4-dehydrorhamnose reductase
MTDILITGGQGQVGIELAALAWPDGVTLHVPTRAELDLTSPDSVRAYFAGKTFAAIVNPAAYTAVDKAESEIGAAFAVNALGPALLAEAAKASDDADRAYLDRLCVRRCEGRRLWRKRSGEPAGRLWREQRGGRAGDPVRVARAVILRTAWVVSPHRGNFVKTMLRVGAQNPKLRVVDDQRGCPTAAADIAQAVAKIALRLIADQAAPTGTYQFVNAGETTWCGLARHIFAAAGRFGGPQPEVEAITTADYPTPARRPANSRLSTAKLAADYGIRSPAMAGGD